MWRDQTKNNWETKRTPWERMLHLESGREPCQNLQVATWTRVCHFTSYLDPTAVAGKDSGWRNAQIWLCIFLKHLVSFCCCPYEHSSHGNNWKHGRKFVCVFIFLKDRQYYSLQPESTGAIGLSLQQLFDEREEKEKHICLGLEGRSWNWEPIKILWLPPIYVLLLIF